MIALTQDIDIRMLGDSIDLTSIQAKLHKSYEALLSKDALYVSFNQTPAFVFSYGVIVTWGMKIQDKVQLLDKVLSATSKKNATTNWESFQFEVVDGEEMIARNDKFQLPDDAISTKLALSHAMAQSACLETFEELAENTIVEHQYLAETLAKAGKVPLNRKQLAKLRGCLYKTKHDILLRYNLLDTPEYFQEYPEHESLYLRLANYLGLQSRVKLLSIKLQTIQDLLDMLASELNHKHAAFLEWIIIVLIAANIAFFGINVTFPLSI